MSVNTVADPHERCADNLIALLRMKCTRGMYSQRLFRTVAKGPEKYYGAQKLEWMKDFLRDRNQQIAAGCLECLVRHGMKLSDFAGLMEERMGDTMFSNAVIVLAEGMNDPDTLLLYMDEERPYLNRVMIALKNTGNESYMSSLMFSENESLARAVNRMTNEPKQ